MPTTYNVPLFKLKLAPLDAFQEPRPCHAMPCHGVPAQKKKKKKKKKNRFKVQPVSVILSLCAKFARLYRSPSQPGQGQNRSHTVHTYRPPCRAREYYHCLGNVYHIASVPLTKWTYVCCTYILVPAYTL